MVLDFDFGFLARVEDYNIILHRRSLVIISYHSRGPHFTEYSFLLTVQRIAHPDVELTFIRWFTMRRYTIRMRTRHTIAAVQVALNIPTLRGQDHEILLHAARIAFAEI